MTLHTIFPSLCIKHLVFDGDREITCKLCGKWIGSIHEEGVYVIDDYKRFIKEIRNSNAVKEYSVIRSNMDQAYREEWENFLRNLKPVEDEVFTMGTTGGWISEDCGRENPSGC